MAKGVDNNLVSVWLGRFASTQVRHALHVSFRYLGYGVELPVLVVRCLHSTTTTIACGSEYIRKLNCCCW